MAKIELIQPKPRVEDWRVTLNGRTVGSVWRAGADYIASVSSQCRLPTKEAAFDAARKMAKAIRP